MNGDEENFKDDVLIEIKLSRSQYVVLKNMLRREEAYGTFVGMIKSNWIFIVAGGVLSLWALWDKITLLGVK